MVGRTLEKPASGFSEILIYEEQRFQIKGQAEIWDIGSWIPTNFSRQFDFKLSFKVLIPLKVDPI